jgi:hypothetical protein
MHVVCLGLEAILPGNRHWPTEQKGFKGTSGLADAVKMATGSSINTPAIVIGRSLICTTCRRHLLPL